MLRKINLTEKEYELFSASVTDLDDEGRGIASVDGREIFIDGALTGEQVSVY
jgi:tRNA/tmRNA/rRNA uracil-C5-methylase (TrmA/RlmC/RlmD family)